MYSSSLRGRLEDQCWPDSEKRRDQLGPVLQGLVQFGTAKTINSKSIMSTRKPDRARPNTTAIPREMEFAVRLPMVAPNLRSETVGVGKTDLTWPHPSMAVARGVMSGRGWHEFGASAVMSIIPQIARRSRAIFVSRPPSLRHTHNAFKPACRWARPLYQSLSGEHACSESDGGRVGQIHALQFVTGSVQMRFHGAES
jgi:hypothetical protein